MTPFERYQHMLNGEPVDIYPRTPILMQYAAEHIGSNYGAFASDHRVLVEANIACAKDFDFDQVSCISDPYRETSGFGAEIKYHENGVPECVTPPLADLDEIEDLEELTIPQTENSVRMKDRVDAIKAYKKQLGETYSILGWVEGPAALAGDLRGLTDFLMDLIDEPEYSAQLLDICTDTSIQFALEQIKAGADTIGIGDAICSQISPTSYDELIWSRQKRLVDAIRSAGASVRLHICGQTQHLWPKLKELDINIFDCDHMVDLQLARATFPPKVVLAGNLDPVGDIRNGTPDEIKAKLNHCIDLVGTQFMVNAGCEIPSGTPKENVVALCEPITPR
ncbi:uroporphyrinogen decarboxylase family protein [Pelagicoccus mobilis]|uniref:Uroporphyrinogen decarboxylase family protein n=1 Tax=Pelagicoccus mobilis TaxID=415221 RepID=A0A934RUY6_9BACT|nr:uroporphyrinogen decarboxylase family protein [Pelagicoccus mobilis]MBK1875609.1 uroporphyrinogen decarboxylase family protein [Pelagicoccus mobilis]